MTDAQEKSLLENPNASYTSEQELKIQELQLKYLLKELMSIFSLSKDIEIKIKDSATAIEFQVYYAPEDHKEITLLSGLRQRIIRELFNELSISMQKQQAILKKIKFNYQERKVLLVTFHNRGKA